MGRERSTTMRGLVRWTLRVGTFLILAAAVEYGVMPKLAGAERTARLLATVNPWWVLTGLVMEVLSLVSYSQLSLRILDVHDKGLLWMLRTDLSGLAVSHLVPGGAAAGNAVRYRLLRAADFSVEDASAGVTLEGIGSLLALLTVLWVSLLAAAVRYGPSPLYLTPVFIGAIVVSVVALTRRRTRGTAAGTRLMRAMTTVLPRRYRPRVLAALQRFGADAIALVTDRHHLWDCARWAMANWCFDAASLWCFVAAFGVHLDPVGAAVAYAVANTLGTLPITPGGLGLVEGALIPSLIAFGAPAQAALLGALSWRLFEFWVPIPVGGLAYLSLRAQARFAPLPVSEELKESRG